jgi:glycosyltransferase involved in cell wall biosynthesis
MIGEAGVGGSVSLEGPARELASDMEQASVFVLSSRHEGLPLVLLEAMSKGMAVVSFDCPTGPGDVIEDHRNGLLVPDRDVDGLARGLAEIMADADLRRRCGDAAAATARGYRMDAVGPRWEALMRELWSARTG